MARHAVLEHPVPGERIQVHARGLPRPFFAISPNPLRASGRADSNMNGRSGTSAVSPALNCSNCITSFGNAFASVDGRSCSRRMPPAWPRRLRMHHLHDVRKRRTLAGTGAEESILVAGGEPLAHQPLGSASQRLPADHSRTKNLNIGPQHARVIDHPREHGLVQPRSRADNQAHSNAGMSFMYACVRL